MGKVYFRFYEELNNYLSEEKRKMWFNFNFNNEITVLSAILLLNVPAKEIDLILINQKSEGFDYILKNNDRISVYPKFELFDISELNDVRDRPLRETKFICDVHLGKLSRYLRMLGFDSLYSNQYSNDEIIKISYEEKRIILSKNIKFKKYEEVTHFYWIRSSNTKEQLIDIIKKMQLENCINPYTRCIECNDLIQEIEKNKIKKRLLTNTLKYFNEFNLCSKCNKIYWKGSHYEDMNDFITNKLLIELKFFKN